MQLPLVLALGFLAVACQPPLKKVDEKQVFTLNGLRTEKAWCHVQSIADDMQVVTRYRFSTKTMLVDRLALREGHNSLLSLAAVFDYSKAAVATETTARTSFRVAEVSEPLELTRYQQQASEAEKLRSRTYQPDLRNPLTPFSPDRALVVEAMQEVKWHEKSETRELYPCESYSEDLDFTLGEEKFGYPLPPAALQLAAARVDLDIKLSLEQTRPELADVMTGKKWCAWQTNAAGALSIETLTVEDNLVVFKRIDPLGRSVGEHAPGYYRAQLSSTQEMEINHAGVTRHFVPLQETSGEWILVEVKDSESAIPLPQVYFSCDDSRWQSRAAVAFEGLQSLLR